MGQSRAKIAITQTPPHELKSKQDRLMPGENPKSIRPRDAAHWMEIYAEMIEFKRQVLGRVTVGLDGVSQEARSELSEDVDLIEAQMRRYERRLRFWSDRAGELNGVDASAKAVRTTLVRARNKP
jgi:hypothetical protein